MYIGPMFGYKRFYDGNTRENEWQKRDWWLEIELLVMSRHVIHNHGGIMSIVAGVILEHFEIDTDMKGNMVLVMDG